MGDILSDLNKLECFIVGMLVGGLSLGSVLLFIRKFEIY